MGPNCLPGSACPQYVITPAGIYNVQVTNANSASNTVPFTVTPSASTLPVITTTSLPNGMVGTAYSVEIDGTNSGPYGTYGWGANNLPPGLTLNSSSLCSYFACPVQPATKIVGTPTTAGTYSVTINLVSDDGQTVSKQLNLVIASS